MESPVRSTLIFPETRVSSPKSPQCSIASCSPPISPHQEILSDRDLHPPPKQKLKLKLKQKQKQKQKEKEKEKEKEKQKLKQKRKHWGPCASDKPFPCSHSRPHSDEGLDEGHVDVPRRKRRKIRFFQNRFFQNHFSKGDVVWAKAFPYTWWPGWIGRIEGSFAWVSFYGCKKSLRFRVLEICGFEESYRRISKMAGVKLADEINLALEDFSRRTVIALTSCCWVSPVESSGVSADHIARVRESFDSREMLRFVNDLGVSACVADEETARVVRLSAQVHAYRSYASMCRHSELAGDFSAADMLEFARDFAVSLFIDSVGDSVLSAVLDRFDEFRRFVSVCPRWMYRQRVELEEAFPSDESLGKEDLPDLSSESEIVYGGILDPDDEFVDNILDTEFEITQQQELEVLEGPEVCMLNQADYIFFDMDEEYESLPNCLEVAVEQGNSTWKGISVDPTLELETPFTGMSLMEVDFGTTCNKNILSADDGSVFHAIEQASVHLSCYKDDNLPENVEDILNSSTIPLSREIVAYGNISLSNSESEKGEEKDDIAMNIEHEDDDSTPEQRFSVNFPTDETVSSDKEIKFTGAQSSSDVCSVVQDGVPRGVIDNSSTVASSAEQRFSVNFPTDETVSSDKEIKFIGAQSSSDVCCVVQDGVPRGVIDNNSTVASSAEHRFSVNLPTDETVFSDKEIKFTGAQSSSDVCSVVQDGVPRGVIDNSSTVASSAEHRFSVNFPTDETVSSDKEIKFIGAQSSSDVCCVVQDGVPRGIVDNNSTVASSAEHRFPVNLPTDETVFSDKEIKFTGAQSSSDVFCVVQDGVPRGVIDNSSTGASSAEQRFSVNFPTDETVSSDKEIKFIGAQSSSDVCCVVQDGAPRGVIDNSSTVASPTKALSPNSIERRRDNLVNNFFKLHKSLVPYAEALSYAKVFVEYVTSTGYDTCSYDGSITGNNIDEKKALLAASSEHCSPSGANKTDKTNGFHRLTLPNCASSRKIRQKKHDKLISSGSLKWTRFYYSPMMRERSKPTSRAKNSSSISRPPTSPKSLHMKFPKDFIMPSKEELEKKFRVFGRLDRSRTKLFFYTGAALVVFLRNTDADAAYRYVKQKSIFDCANVRFWFYEHEKFRMKPSFNDHIIPEKEVLSSLDHTPSHECIGVVQKEDNRKILCRGDSHKSTSPNMGHSPSNLKSCLKSPDARNGENSKKACKVRFTIET